MHLICGPANEFINLVNLSVIFMAIKKRTPTPNLYTRGHFSLECAFKIHLCIPSCSKCLRKMCVLYVFTYLKNQPVFRDRKR